MKKENLNPFIRYPQDKVNSNSIEKIASLKEFTCSENGQKQITNFIDNLRNDVENPTLWQQTCQKAETEISQKPITANNLQKLFHTTNLYVDEMSPGHDRGHLFRDALIAIYLYSQVKNKSNNQAEALAAMVGGIFHDFGVAIVPRHFDKQFGAGHSEVGAYLFWQLTENIFGDNFRKLVCYTIAAHTNYQKEIPSQIPHDYIKKPYLENHATNFVRAVDRVDIHSPTQTLRSLMAQIYSNAIQQNGSYESDGKWVEMSSETAINLSLPLIVSHTSGQPTAIEHSLAFIRNNQKENNFNRYDKFIPGLLSLMDERSNQTLGLGDITAQTTLDVTNSNKITDLSDIKTVFQKTSLSNPEKFNIFWKEFTNIWEKLTPDCQQSWQLIFQYIDDSRLQNLIDAQQKINTINPNFKTLYQKILVTLFSRHQKS